MVLFMRRKAYAKITLYLEVKDRIDGLLQFRNIIVPIDVFDMVYLDVHETMHIETNKSYLPNDRRNTVYKAIELMKEKYNIKDNFKVSIVKNIPAQSGLGGGSADAACVINMLNEKYQLNMSRQDLIDIASQIDEDTAFCLFNQPALVEGYGEIVTPIPFNAEFYYVIVKPGYGVSTKSFLKKYSDFIDQDVSRKKLEKAMAAGNPEEIMPLTHNDFQITVTKKRKDLNKVVNQLKSLGLEGVCMSGSGTSIYGFTTDKEKAIKIYEKLVFKYPFLKYGKICGKQLE